MSDNPMQYLPSSPRFPELSVAESLTEVTEHSTRFYRGVLPGFQVSEALVNGLAQETEAEVAAVLGLRGEAVGRVLAAIEDGAIEAGRPPVLFDTSSHTPHADNIGPHVDGSQKGASVQVPLDGYYGTVEIAYMQDRLWQPRSAARILDIGMRHGGFYRGMGLRASDREVETIHHGEVVPYRLTVTSVGNLPGLPSAAHCYTHRPDLPSVDWDRWSSHYTPAARQG